MQAHLQVDEHLTEPAPLVAKDTGHSAETNDNLDYDPSDILCVV